MQAAICRALSRVLQGREDGYELLKSKLTGHRGRFSVLFNDGTNDKKAKIRYYAQWFGRCNIKRRPCNGGL